MVWHSHEFVDRGVYLNLHRIMVDESAMGGLSLSPPDGSPLACRGKLPWDNTRISGRHEGARL